MEKEYPLSKNYIVYDNGSVYSVIYKRFMKQQIDRYGYKYVSLVIDGKKIKKKVHRMVCETFLDNTDRKEQVNHKNGIKTDNRLENLEWCSSYENMRHLFNNHPNSKQIRKKMSLKRFGIKLSDETKKKMSNSKRYDKNGRARKVICVETGIIYNSIKEASQKTGARLAGIYESLCKSCRTKTAGGYHWEYCNKGII